MASFPVHRDTVVLSLLNFTHPLSFFWFQTLAASPSQRAREGQKLYGPHDVRFSLFYSAFWTRSPSCSVALRQSGVHGDSLRSSGWYKRGAFDRGIEGQNPRRFGRAMEGISRLSRNPEFYSRHEWIFLGSGIGPCCYGLLLVNRFPVVLCKLVHCDVWLQLTSREDISWLPAFSRCCGDRLARRPRAFGLSIVPNSHSSIHIADGNAIVVVCNVDHSAPSFYR